LEAKFGGAEGSVEDMIADAKQAAIDVAKKYAEQIAAGTYEDLDAFDKAINELLTKHFDSKDTKTGETTDDKKEEEKLKYVSTKVEDQLYSSVNSLFIDWLIGKVETDDADKKDEEQTYIVRQEGELTVIVSESGSGDSKTVNGFYVIRFGNTNENNFALKNVRHLLVAFEGGKYNSTTGTTTYTDAEKEKARTEAMKLKLEFEAGEMSEEAFAKLATEKTKDTGSKENGGLYENVYPGQMVEAFEDWCYDESRKPGDLGLVETTYGYHIMYFVGDSEVTYRDFMLENDLRSETMKEWHDGLVKAITFKVLTDKYVNKDLILG
ncbi:MAG: peptidylprolyl isomerase, partial [Oscillospiraceae bacterium]|nr:peptidylprolyl isomerase [Oscillospiraceae bacterium]